jgi:ketosteroid isomerase-like protein
MNVRWFFVFSILLVANAAQAKGKYERARDGKTRVWHNEPDRHVQASWSGDRDDNGYATGRGTLTWYRVQKTWLTGSLLPTTKYVQVSSFTGKMVEGKLEGSVENVAANGNTYHAKFADGRKKTDWIAGPLPSKQKAAIAESGPTVAIEAPAEAPPPAPVLEEHVAEKPKGPAITQKPKEAAATQQPNEASVSQQAKETAVAETSKEEPARPSDSLQSLAMPPSSLRVAALNAPSPQPSLPTVEITAASPESAPATSNSMNDDDARTVAALDTEYQAAVKTNDAAAIDRILADDFVLVAGAGRTMSKSDVLKQARDKQAKYEHHEIDEGTQKVRVWRDTAVVTATLWVKGTENGKAVDHKVSVSDTYVRTPAGWRYVSGQVSTPAEAK